MKLAIDISGVKDLTHSGNFWFTYTIKLPTGDKKSFKSPSA